jgi:zinc/manganese transport system substrate-binding protein
MDVFDGRPPLSGTSRLLRVILGVLVFGLVGFVGAAWVTAKPYGGIKVSRTLNVVAGENFWGSLASQLGGSHVRVTSVVSDPNADPHEYESDTADARAFAAANYVILNGAGYDDWGTKLLAANPEPLRKVFTVATLLGKQEGDNPHFWYDPTYVEMVINQITSDYEHLDPVDTPYFQAQHVAVETSLAPYWQRLANIKTNYAGTPVAATEDIFAYMANYTGLDLISPPAFMQAVAEGNDPPAQSVVSFDRQLQATIPKVLVYNMQTSTAVTTNIKQLAAEQNIPVIGVTETIQPPTATFQEWMDAQLDDLTNALNANVLGN